MFTLGFIFSDVCRDDYFFFHWLLLKHCWKSTAGKSKLQVLHWALTNFVLRKWINNWNQENFSGFIMKSKLTKKNILCNFQCYFSGVNERFSAVSWKPKRTRDVCMVFPRKDCRINWKFNSQPAGVKWPKSVISIGSELHFR